MSASLAFLRFVAKAALNYISFGVGGDFAVEVLPHVAGNVWQWWAKGRSECQRRDELQEVAQLTFAEAQCQAEQAVDEDAARLPEEQRKNLAVYLSLIPSAIRQSQRRPSDPTGRTMSSNLPLQDHHSLLPFLPTRIPRFKSGDTPPGAADWKLEELLGMGGFGEVWRAWNPNLGELAAFKFCLDPAAAKALHNEKNLLGRVKKQGKHPGIVQLLDTSLDREPPWLRYEFVNGGELTGIIRDARPHGGRPPMEAARIVQEVAEVIGFAHQLNPPIVHRDLKPANVLVEKSADGSMAYRVADFGIGGVASDQAIGQTRVGNTSGQRLVSSLRGAYTPLYASPQQMLGAPPTPATMCLRWALSGINCFWAT